MRHRCDLLFRFVQLGVNECPQFLGASLPLLQLLQANFFSMLWRCCAAVQRMTLITPLSQAGTDGRHVCLCVGRGHAYRGGVKRVRVNQSLCLALVLLGGCEQRQSQPITMTAPEPAAANATQQTLTLTEAEWRARLSPEQFRVLREAGTERAFGKAYEEFNSQGAGTYLCGGCGAELFSSNHKFDSHCGWPSFYDPANAKNVRTLEDHTGGRSRVEVRCAVCDGHLGHVFKGEGFATPTDQRYCINGVALKFVPKPAAPKLP